MAANVERYDVFETRLEKEDKAMFCFDSFDFIKGEQVWNFANFQISERIMRVGGNKKGIFTRDRQPKAAGFYFKNRKESLPGGCKNIN
jgi:beta-glucuronidase